MIFVSYPRTESTFAADITERLVNADHAVWADWLEIGRTPKWQSYVVKALEQSTHLLAISCDAYWLSENCQFEHQTARAMAIPIVELAPDGAPDSALPSFYE